MKKEYTIRVVLDDTMKPSQSSETRIRRNDPTDITLVLNVNDPRNNGSLIDVAAHELGHVLGGIFDTPGHRADPRTSDDVYRIQTMELFGPDEEEREGILESEREAWDLAEKMVPVDQRKKAWALRTYENA